MASHLRLQSPQPCFAISSDHSMCSAWGTRCACVQLLISYLVRMLYIAWQSQEEAEHHSVNCVTTFRCFLWTLGAGGRRVPDYEYMCNKPDSEFFTGQAEYSQSCECLGPGLAMECSMMKSSMLCYLNVYLSPSTLVYLTSTWRHSHDKCSQAFPVFAALLLPCIILNANQKTKTGEAWERGYMCA